MSCKNETECIIGAQRDTSLHGAGHGSILVLPKAPPKPPPEGAPKLNPPPVPGLLAAAGAEELNESCPEDAPPVASRK